MIEWISNSIISLWQAVGKFSLHINGFESFIILYSL